MEVDKRIEEAVTAVRSHVFKDEFESMVQTTFRDLIDSFPTAELIASVFSICKGSGGRSILLHLPNIIESVNLNDFKTAFKLLMDDELGTYYYVRFLLDEFGIDSNKLLEQDVDLRSKSNFRGVHHAMSVVSIQISEEDKEDERYIQFKRNWSKMKDQGAPVIELK
jgi:hypothetical protein